MPDGVYIDAKNVKGIVGIKPKPAFWPVFELATTREGSGISLVKEQPVQDNESCACESSTTGSHTHMCSWWRRGRLNPPQLQIPVIIPHPVRPEWRAYTVAWAG